MSWSGASAPFVEVTHEFCDCGGNVGTLNQSTHPHPVANLRPYQLNSGNQVFCRGWCTMWYFEEGCVVLWRGLCGTLKRVAWYFEEGCVELCFVLVVQRYVYFSIIHVMVVVACNKIVLLRFQVLLTSDCNTKVKKKPIFRLLHCIRTNHVCEFNPGYDVLCVGTLLMLYSVMDIKFGIIMYVY